MKMIELKRIYAYLIYSNLKRTAPKEFTDVDEMIATVDDILPAFEASIVEFVAFKKRADDLFNRQSSGSIDEKEMKEMLIELQKEVRKYELSVGEEKVEIEVENAGFSKFIEQFKRWGKNWFAEIKDFVEVQKALNAAELVKK